MKQPQWVNGLNKPTVTPAYLKRPLKGGSEGQQ